MVERSNSGFGKPGYSLARMLRYSYSHMDDGSSIDLSVVDELLHAIKENRLKLDRMDIFYTEFLREINRIGNNINQIAKRMNLENLLAAEEGTDDYELGKKLLELADGFLHRQTELLEKVKAFISSVSQDREAIKDVLSGEDDLLTRCLVFPSAGGKEQQYKVLLRKIKDYIGDTPYELYRHMTIDRFLWEIQEKSKDEHK